MKKVISKRKKILRYVVISVLAVVLAFGIFTAIAAYRMSLIPSMTFQKMLNYTTKDNKDAVITVGIIKGASMSYTVYGKSGTILPSKEYTYEIGSATKTFTCSLLCKAISEGRVKLTDSIDRYISLPESNYYPTFGKLVTHTSGYKGYYFNWQMVNNFFHRQKTIFTASVKKHSPNKYRCILFGIRNTLFITRILEFPLLELPYPIYTVKTILQR